MVEINNTEHEAARRRAIEPDDDDDNDKHPHHDNSNNGNGNTFPPLSSWRISVREVVYVLMLATGWLLGWADLKGRMNELALRLELHEQQAASIERRLTAHENAPGHSASLERWDALRDRLDKLEAIERGEAWHPTHPNRSPSTR